MTDDTFTVSARFTPQAWVNDYAVGVDPEGPRVWNATAYARKHTAYVIAMLARADDTHDVLDYDDVFRHDPAAPAWVRDWHGPFDIHLTVDGSLTDD
jgi:hypothetical protein